MEQATGHIDKTEIFNFSGLKQELKIRGYSLGTIETYCHYNEQLLRFARKRPLEVTNQDVRNYLEHLFDKNKSRATIRSAYNALYFYYTTSLGKKVI